MLKDLRKKMTIVLAFIFMITGIVFIQPQTANAGTQATFYISPTGNDSAGNGSSANPWATIQKARDYIRTNYPTQTGDIIVYLKNGTYTLSSTVTFGPSDSGKNGYRIIYKNDTGATPVISGGVDITTGWTLHDASQNIYKKTGINWSFRQLYVDHKKGIRARTPNLTDDITDGPYFSAYNGTYPYSVDPSNMGSWANSGTTEMVTVSHWKQQRGRISNYSGNTVYFKAPENTFCINHIAQGGAPHYFENAYDLLDAEGEWFLDKANTTLYYKPRSGETMNTTNIVAPKVETLISFEGTGTSNKTSNITFSGITFRHSNWLAPDSYGYVAIQAGFRIQTVASESLSEPRGSARYTPVAGMIQLKYTSNISIDHNLIQFGGGWGIMGMEGTDHTSVSWNTIEKIACGAVAFGVVAGACDEVNGCPLDGQSQYDSVTDNTIDRAADDYADAVGIGAMVPQNMTIAGNEVKNLPYTGISIGWNWTDNEHGMTNNQVYGNRIHHVIRLLDDGGGIYSLAKMSGGSNFHHNYIHDLVRSAYTGGYPIAGIYFDNGSCYKTGEYNVLNNTENAFYAYNSPNYSNTIQYNYHNVSLGSTGSNTVQYNTSVSGQNWPQAAIDIMNAAGPGGIAPPTPTPDPHAPVNVALNKTATASSEYSSSYAASYAVDGISDINHKWNSAEGQSEPHWLKVDLGANYDISRWVVKHENQSQYVTRDFKLQKSSDGTNWIDVDSVTGNVSFTTDRNVTTFTTRYVRLYITDGCTQDYYARVYEFEAWGTSSGGATPTPTPAPTHTATSTPTSMPTPGGTVPTDYRVMWGFNNNWNDSSANGFNLTAYGNAAFNPADKKEGTHSATLDGGGDYGSASLVTSNTDNVTLSTWVKWGGATSTHQVIIYSGNTGSNGYGLYLDYSQSNKLAILCGGKAVLQSQATLSTSAWTHILAARRSGTWELYVNGSQVSITNNTTAPNTPAGNTCVGGDQSGGNNFKGLVDDTRIYQSALSTDEIAALYSGGGATPTSTPTPTPTPSPTSGGTVPTDYRAMWGFNNNWNDSSANGFNLTAYGNAAFNSADKKEGTHSATLDGGGDYGSASLVASNTDNVTLSTWVKWGGATSTHQVILYSGNTGSNGYGLYLDYGQGNKLAILCGGISILQSQTTLSTSAWTHILAVRRSGAWELYVNGSQASVTNNTTAPNTPSGSTYVGGDQSGGNNFKGLVDNTRIYQRALTSNEIAALAAQ